MDRVLVIDALRGVAIVLMLFQHAPMYLLEGYGGSDFYSYAVVVSRLSAPLFFLLTGYSVVLSGRRRIPAQGKAGFMGHAACRCLTLFLLGFPINVFMSKPILYFNVLHVIAFMVFFASLIYVSGSKKAYLTVLALFLFYCLIGPRLVPHMTVDSPVSLVVWFMSRGEYPFGAWFLDALVGMGAAMYAASFRAGRIYLFYSGWLLVIVALLFVPAGYRNTLITNPPPMFFMSMGLILLAYYFLELMQDWRVTERAVGFLAVYGRHSLVFFLGHHFLLGYVPALLGFRNVFSVLYVLAAYSLFLLFFYAAARLAEKSG